MTLALALLKKIALHISISNMYRQFSMLESFRSDISFKSLQDLDVETQLLMYQVVGQC